MQSPGSNLIFLAVLAAMFYFLIIRPQRRRAVEHDRMLGLLKPGDEIVTVGGIFATVVEKDDRVRVRVADGSELEIAPQAVSRIVNEAVDDDASDIEHGR